MSAKDSKKKQSKEKSKGKSLLHTSPEFNRLSLAIFAAIFIIGGLYYLSNLLATDTAATITMEPENTTLVPGQSVDIPVYVDSGHSEMDSVQAKITFDTSQLELTGVNDEGSDFGVEAPTEQNDGEVIIARGNTSPLTGRNLLVELSFNVLAQSGTGTVSFDTEDTLVLAGGEELITTREDLQLTFAGNADVYLNPASGDVSSGDEFQVSIMVDSGEFNMDAAEVRLDFNPSEFSYVSHENSQSNFGVDANFDSGEGFIQITGGSTNELSGDQLLAIVTFDALGEGTSAPITINDEHTRVAYAGGSLQTNLSHGEYQLSDTTPPSVPTNVSAEAVSKTQVDLTWSASSDNVGVSGYDVYRNGNRVASGTVDTSFSDTGLELNTEYTYYVVAVDAADNTSDPSTEVTAKTHRKTGDLNGDNEIDIFDLSVLLSAWEENDENSDLNDDGIVDILDLSVLLSNWGE